MAKDNGEIPALSPAQIAQIAQVAGTAMAAAPMIPRKAALDQDVLEQARASADPTSFDTTGWKRFKCLTDGAPVYWVPSRDGKTLYHPRFKVGTEVLLPLDEQTARYVEFGNLEALDEVGAAYARSATTASRALFGR